MSFSYDELTLEVRQSVQLFFLTFYIKISGKDLGIAHGFVPIVIINGIRRYIAEDLSSTVAFDFSDCLYPCAIYGD